MTEPSKLSPGELVRSRRGKDEGQIAVVIALVDERFALVADGDKRRFDRPKRKNVLHLEPLGIVNDEVANSLRDTGRVTNGKLRFAIGSVQRRLEAHAEEKGE
ncbi:KOW domain-containing RNA-binding protein [Cohnella nanjingensis]|uniref:KOW domain-containing RNA-binding protein n=1 Tax=Cohnella nanjingensis TaxID=1387779 RepID=A0A7X0RWQ8_9BACL|nr:KOW domain-containing RNA-binding protein [Cohnella nanjingensis]MBB6675078.1 KOW domain-containing RNA-binding protein [Cohnella nanjingensis]